MKNSLKIKQENNIDLIYNDLILQFPPNELKDYDKFKKLLSDGVYKLNCFYEQDILIGYILFAKIQETNSLWIDYVAVLKTYQSKGYGLKMFQTLKEYFNSYSGCYLEIEKPNEADINTIKRINFYKNLDAVKLPINYYYPNKNGDLAMDLYFINFNDEIPPKNQILSSIQIVFKMIHSDINHTKLIFEKIKSEF